MKKPGAQIGHRGHSKIVPRPTKSVRISLDLHVCHSRLRRKGMRKRIIEGILVIRSEAIEYRIRRLYCSRCHKIYEP